MQWLDLTAISDQRRNAGGVNMGWGEWGDWSDMAPIITQVAPVEASILSVPSLMCLFSAVVEGATNILWYINDVLISEKPSGGNNTSTTIFDNDPPDPEKDLPQLDPEGVLVPVRKLMLKVVNSQEEESIKEWNKYYYINEPDPLEALVDSVSPSVDGYNLQVGPVDGYNLLTFTVNFKMPSSIMWIVDRGFTGDYLDGVKSEVNVMSSSYTYDGDTTIFGGSVAEGHHTITAMITSLQYGYGCCGVHWKHWIIPDKYLIEFSAVNSSTGSSNQQAIITSTIGLRSVTWDPAGYYRWDFRIFTFAKSTNDDFTYQKVIISESSNYDNINVVAENSPECLGASYANSKNIKAAVLVGSMIVTTASIIHSYIGVALTINEILNKVGLLNHVFVSTPETTEISWNYWESYTDSWHWLQFEIRTYPVEYQNPQNKVHIKSTIGGPNYIPNNPTIDFEITLPNLNSPNGMESTGVDPSIYGLEIEDGKWVFKLQEGDDNLRILQFLNVEALDGEIIED